jgi:hypothetical protein
MHSVCIKTSTTRPLVLKTFLVIFTFTTTTYLGAQSWQALNPPLNIFNGTIYATTLDSSGYIYTSGNFKNINNNYFVARWSGSNWIEVGSGTASLGANGAILSLAHRGDTIYASGAFVNQQFKYYVARWDGHSWTELDKNASLKANGSIYSIAADKTGNVYAAGSFTDNIGQYYVAKWNGTTWTELGTGSNALNANGFIYSVTVDASGNVYAAGHFTDAGGKYYVAKWNGITWSLLGTGTNAFNANDFINCLATDANGNVYAAGGFKDSSGECYLAKWNGSSWQELGMGAGALHANSNINTIAVKNGSDIYVAGLFTDLGGRYYVAHWDGSSWSQLASPQSYLQTNDDVKTISVDAAGTVYAGGKFLNKSGHAYVARWNGNKWDELGATGDPLYSNGFSQLLGDSVGNVYVTANVGSSPLQYWNGKTWRPMIIPDSLGLGFFLAGSHSILLDKKGKLYVTGRKRSGNSYYDCILTWDGSAWNVLEDFPNSLGSDGTNPAYGLNEIEIDAQGNIYVEGSFSDAAYGQCNLAKWNGTTWSRLPGSYPTYIKNFCVALDGNIFAFGSFTDEFGRAVIANFNPATHSGWTEVKAGNSKLAVPGLNIFSAIAMDDKNNLYVNGYFTDSASRRYIAKWNGSNWSELGPTTSLGLALALDRDGNVYTNKESSNFGDPIKKWNGSSWVAIGMPSSIDPLDFNGSLLAIDAAGNIYSDAASPEPGVGGYIVKFGTLPSGPPKLSSFNPSRGSVGTTITINGHNLFGTKAVSFGGTNAASYSVKNDSTITAVVAHGSTGSLNVKTAYGEDSLKTFTYTCDSVTGPVPVISLVHDSVLVSSQANYYQWYLNNNQLTGQVSDSLVFQNAGFYHVETSADNTCWVPSLDYPILFSRNPNADSLKLQVYPNPSTGNFTAYVRLPRVSTVIAYVQVFDVSGIKVFESSKLIFYGNEIRIPVSINTKGTYFVKMTINDKTVQQTVVIT